MNVAYQGVPGAFGHDACLTFLPDHEPLAKTSFAAVVAAVESGEAELGMLPVENSTAGPVVEAEAALAESNLAVVAEHWLPVRMHLLALRGSRIDEIRIVSSHPMALKQCTRSVAELGLETREAPNTAMAAQALSEPHEAVLASEAAARAYGLTILRHDLQDRSDNATRFVVIGRKGQ